LEASNSWEEKERKGGGEGRRGGIDHSLFKENRPCDVTSNAGVKGGPKGRKDEKGKEEPYYFHIFVPKKKEVGPSDLKGNAGNPQRAAPGGKGEDGKRVFSTSTGRREHDGLRPLLVVHQEQIRRYLCMGKEREKGITAASRSKKKGRPLSRPSPFPYPSVEKSQRIGNAQEEKKGGKEGLAGISLVKSCLEKGTTSTLWLLFSE